MRRQLPTVVWITLVWVALWGDVSWANVLSGLVVAAFLLLAVRLPPRDTTYRISPLPALRYMLQFARDLTVATAEVARQVFWPVHRLRPAVVEVPMAGTDPGVLALVANSITLTPGTMTLDVDEHRGLLWVHVLHLKEGGIEDLVEQARALERLGAQALGVNLGAARARLRKEDGHR
jgi:multicomponent Na+:H+ antiporter subunit E